MNLHSLIHSFISFMLLRITTRLFNEYLSMAQWLKLSLSPSLVVTALSTLARICRMFSWSLSESSTKNIWGQRFVIQVVVAPLLVLWVAGCVLQSLMEIQNFTLIKFRLRSWSHAFNFHISTDDVTSPSITLFISSYTSYTSYFMPR